MRFKTPNSQRLLGGADARRRARSRNIVLQVPGNKAGAVPCERLLKIFTVACTLLLFFGGPNYYSPRSVKSFWDLGHIVLFAALGSILLVAWSKNKKMSFLRQFVAVILISLILGILIEWAQIGTQRTAEVLDVLRDLVGTFVALSFFAPANKTLPKSYLRTLQAATILLVSFAVIPFVKAVTDESLARMQFPMLSDFETPVEIGRWSGDATLSIDDTTHFHGKSSLKVALSTSKYSGTSLKYFPDNWLNFKFLRLSHLQPQQGTFNDNNPYS